MAILAGIDEAGFGPILGPLVVSSSVFRMPEKLLGANLWEVLEKSVADRRKGLGGRLLIADSKKAFSRTIGIKHLRRTVLAALEHLGSEPKNLTGLVTALCPDCLDRLGEYPWYKHIDDYQLGSDDATITIGAAMLARNLKANHIELLGVKSRCLEVAHYNKMISAVKNKAKVLFSATAELIGAITEKFANEDINIVIDRQGGRSHYQRQLQLMFGEAQLKILRENQRLSSYELKTGKRRVRIHFAVGADDKYLPVSLASMASKYLREVLVDNINRYFISFNNGLKPTAGYWKDGLRFIEDIKTHIPGAGYDANQLIRIR